MYRSRYIPETCIPAHLGARVELNREDDEHGAALGRWKRQSAEPVHHAVPDSLIGDRRPSAIERNWHGAGLADDELHTDTALQVLVAAEAVLVAETESVEVPPDDTLDGLRGEYTEPSVQIDGTKTARLLESRTIRLARIRRRRSGSLGGHRRVAAVPPP
jgi:hypothetical protein